MPPPNLGFTSVNKISPSKFINAWKFIAPINLIFDAIFNIYLLIDSTLHTSPLIDFPSFIKTLFLGIM